MSYRQPFHGEYIITQRYGEKITDPNGHTGIDYGCPEGTEILASDGGTVMRAAFAATGYGNYVIIRHQGNVGTVYAHLKFCTVKVGDEVRQGDVIGYSGNTGNSTGPHLHFEARSVWSDYTKHFDPMLLPLICVDDGTSRPDPEPVTLTGADALGDQVEVVAPSGAWGWNRDFSKRETVFACGTELHYTGRTTQHGKYTYCECYPDPAKYWVAVNDGETQILK